MLYSKHGDAGSRCMRILPCTLVMLHVAPGRVEGDRSRIAVVSTAQLEDLESIIGDAAAEESLKQMAREERDAAVQSQVLHCLVRDPHPPC